MPVLHNRVQMDKTIKNTSVLKIKISVTDKMSLLKLIYSNTIDNGGN